MIQLNLKVCLEISANKFNSIHQEPIRQSNKNLLENSRQINHHSLIEIAVQEFKQSSPIILVALKLKEVYL